MVLLVPFSRMRPATIVVVVILIAAVFIGAVILKNRGDETWRRGEPAPSVPTK